ncbi:MAG: PaaI family thioesterase [Anaerolineales bacterium]|nr:PaaI family thioesterase [Anaerolineales bacterium]
MEITHEHKLPNSRNCFACGMENHTGLKLTFYAQPDGSVAGDYTVPQQFEGYPGITHGGIVASILDEAVSRVFMVADHNRFMYTGRLTTRLRRHVPVGQPLRITGRALRDRGRTAEAEAHIFGPDGELLAEGQALLVALPPEDMQSGDLDELGWGVCPDE